jgi:hypothetical protein
VCLIVITLAWILMLIGIWWPQSQPAAPLAISRTGLRTLPIGSVGPFADCSADLAPAYENQLDLLVENYRDQVNSVAKAALIILVGTTDNRRLAPGCSARFGTSQQLAVARANHIRTQLKQKLSGEHPRPDYALLTSGPRHLEASVEGEGRRHDRAVDAWVVIDTPQVAATPKP